MKNTNTTNFKGIRRNATMNNMSIDARNIERLQRKIMARLYKSFEVITVVEIDENRNVCDEYFLAVTNSPVISVFGEIDEELNGKRIDVRMEKNDKETKEREVTVGEKYRVRRNVVLVKFTGKDKAIEGNYDELRLNGLQLNGETYYAAAGSASLGKKSKVFFVKATEDDQYDAYKKMNELTGNILGEILDLIDITDYKSIAKIAVRISLCATTPSLWAEAGKTNSIFYFHDSILSASEGVDIEEIEDNNRDGYAVISDTKGSDMATELAEEKVSTAQARRMSWQLRIRGAAGKFHGRAYNVRGKLKVMKNLMKIDITKCYAWKDGKKVDLVNMSEKDLLSLAAAVDIISDADTFKWGNALVGKDVINHLEIGIVNMSNATSGKMGSQIAFKLRDDEEEAKEYFRALTAKQLTDESEREGRIGFEKDKLQLSNSTYFNISNINKEKATTDKLLNNFKVKQLDTACLNKVANLKFAVNSLYLRMTPEDSLLNDCEEVLKSFNAKYVLATGEELVVRCVECYSPAWEKKYYELKELVEANENMTEEEREVVLGNMRVAVGIKSPSQGDREKEIFYLVTKEEIKQRNITPEFMQYIEETPNNCVIWAADNTLKHQLAGSDFDGDDMSLFMPEFTMTTDNKIATGIYTPEGKLVNCYTSIIVRKRVREGNIGCAALIVYHEDAPIALYAEDTEKVDNDALAQETLDSLDYSSLL